jgi:hypothetical protein
MDDRVKEKYCRKRWPNEEMQNLYDVIDSLIADRAAQRALTLRAAAERTKSNQGHGDQYGSWPAPCEFAQEHVRDILALSTRAEEDELEKLVAKKVWDTTGLMRVQCTGMSMELDECYAELKRQENKLIEQKDALRDQMGRMTPEEVERFVTEKVNAAVLAAKREVYEYLVPYIDVPRPSHEGPCGPEALCLDIRKCDDSCVDAANFGEFIASLAANRGAAEKEKI